MFAFRVATVRQGGAGILSRRARSVAGGVRQGRGLVLASTAAAGVAVGLACQCVQRPARCSGTGANNAPAALGATPSLGKQPLAKAGGIRFTSKATAETALGARYDTYGGVLIDPESVASFATPKQFGAALESSLQVWRADGKRGIWLKVPTAQVSFVAAAVGQGFEMHHAESTHVMLTLWVPDTPNTLPGYTSHTVGVGAVVFNQRGELLAVQERSGPASGLDFWKYPTGMVDAGEDAAEAAVREVKEETGIEAEVVGLISIREMHLPSGSSWQSGKTNLFFTFVLRPLTEQICKQDSEIAKCEWLPLDKYWPSAEKRMKPGSLYHTISALAFDAARGDSSVRGFDNKAIPLGYRKGTNTLYFPLGANAGDTTSRAKPAADSA